MDLIKTDHTLHVLTLMSVLKRLIVATLMHHVKITHGMEPADTLVLVTLVTKHGLLIWASSTMEVIFMPMPVTLAQFVLTLTNVVLTLMTVTSMPDVQILMVHSNVNANVDSLAHHQATTVLTTMSVQTVFNSSQPVVSETPTHITCAQPMPTVVTWTCWLIPTETATTVSADLVMKPSRPTRLESSPNVKTSTSAILALITAMLKPLARILPVLSLAHVTLVTMVMESTASISLSVQLIRTTVTNKPLARILQVHLLVHVMPVGKVMV